MKERGRERGQANQINQKRHHFPHWRQHQNVLGSVLGCVPLTQWAYRRRQLKTEGIVQEKLLGEEKRVREGTEPP